MPGEEITLGIAFSAGLASFVSPCVLPLIPSFITYIGLPERCPTC
jgi:cytochrome c-type biogenesis protein